MIRSRKVWYGVGACASLAAVATVAERSGDAGIAFVSKANAAATSAPGAATFVGDLDKALQNIFAGEGGEGGAGLSPMWPTVSAPALTGPEIATVITGNSLQLEGHFSYYFTAQQRVEGLFIDWQQMPKTSDRPKQNVEDGEFYLNERENVCWRNKILPLQGSWKIDSHQLCLDVSWSGGKKQECRYVAILLDDIALFNVSGAMEGKGYQLLQGKQLKQ